MSWISTKSVTRNWIYKKDQDGREKAGEKFEKVTTFKGRDWKELRVNKRRDEVSREREREESEIEREKKETVGTEFLIKIREMTSETWPSSFTVKPIVSPNSSASLTLLVLTFSLSLFLAFSLQSNLLLPFRSKIFYHFALLPASRIGTDCM